MSVPAAGSGEQLADDEDFEEFYQAAYRPLVGQLLAVTGTLETAEDVVQEAFIRALARWRTIRAYDVPELWVRRVALNLAISDVRRARRKVAALLRLGAHRPAVALSQETTGVIDILRHVPLSQRPILLLHCVLDLPLDEVARQLDLPVSTVRGRLARAKAHLAKSMSDEREGASQPYDRL